jgi:DNA-binding transcriptional LysR family regulator
MELRHLRYFVAVADELNFRKAAETLSITRPALSKQIKDLENEIGVRLLERDTVSVSLTKSGEIFLHDARDLLKRAVKAVERASEAETGRLGKLRIGSIGVIATDFLPSALQVFHQRYPGVEVTFVELQPAEQLDALDSGAIDVAFAFGSDPVAQSADKDLLRVINSRFGVAVSRHHPWADRGEIPIGDIKDETMLWLGNGPRSHRDQVLRFCQAEGHVPQRSRTIDGFDALVTLVAAEQGISMMPVVLDLTSQGIVILPIRSKNPFEFLMWAVWKLDSPPQVVRHFVQLLEERI